MSKKDKYFEFINNFNKIKLTSICKELKISVQNVRTNKTKEENLKKIKEEIENQLLNLYRGLI